MSTSASAPVDPGYVTIHVTGFANEGVQSLFGRRSKRFGGAFGASTLAHLAAVIAFLVVTNLPPPPLALAPDKPSELKELVWLNVPGPGGGGGGSGEDQPAKPVRKLEVPGQDKLSVPVVKPTPVTPPKEIQKQVEEPPKLALNVPVRTMESGQMTQLGAVDGLSVPSYSPGSGRGGGAGSGQGSGIGPGSGGGTGGGIYQVGSGVSMPQLLYEAKPQYTAEAMRAKIQGAVLVSAVVMQDGTVGNVHIMRSLDSTFGLDQEAVKAVRQWRFRPGLRQGQPVPVQISVEVYFNLR